MEKTTSAPVNPSSATTAVNPSTADSKAEYGAPLNSGRNITPGGHPLDQSQPGYPVYHRKFANPAPLGLISFAGTTLLLSFFNTNTHGVTVSNGIVGMDTSYFILPTGDLSRTD
ncbi:uncharacterized protein P7C70_g242, partial [Phenoliferia sp. Uapishka_3]